MTASAADDRSLAVAAADGTCPRCGTPRTDDQRYCLECGLALPEVSGRLPSLRRRWIRRLGWYPGDWVWTSLATLLVAAAGAAAAIAVSDARNGAAHTYAVVTSPVSVGEPAAPVASTAGSKADTSKLPSAPEPTTPSAPGRTAWPAGESGWTIVLVSYPKSFGHDEALKTARRAAKAGLAQTGVVDSSRYASLQPGYYVVFAGIFGSKTEADAAVATARQAGFGGAYSREIAR